MKVLVTGGAGFIGSSVCEAFALAGHEVVALDNLSSGRRENLSPGIRLIRADIQDKKLAAILLAELPHIVSHHAAQIDVRESVADPAFDAEVNVVGMLNLLEACRDASVRRFVFASSGGACYGEQTGYPATEDHLMRPVSPYGVAKAAGELYLHFYREQYGLPFVALRYANVYGPRQDPHGEAGVVGIFGERLLAGQPCTIYGDGEQTRDFVYVKDVARANVLAALGEETGPFNIGTGRETSINALYAALAQATGVTVEARHAPAKPGEQRRSVIDPALARQRLGWAPEMGLEEGLRETVSWLRQRS
jgi:UDP-glucose 4-epimerase